MEHNGKLFPIINIGQETYMKFVNQIFKRINDKLIIRSVATINGDVLFSPKNYTDFTFI